ncbi:hypothetical protein BJV82DRAFT_674458 [Fennellomyces sp. T-0311]|nr:hypothetical protein BJV82DRAFT_674458 [Fennellomyces sp. T-0311]
MIPDFTDLRKFTSGFLLSTLKNPTYGELRAHMKILLPCVHDQIPLQASLCLRHFIDFYYLATAKEHDYKSLKQMRISIEQYNKLSPIFEDYSNSRMKFPKNHCLLKYINDIESRGVVSSYTINHSELQHKRDAKKPSKRANYHKAGFVTQVSKFINCRDLLHDEYPEPIRSITTVGDHLQSMKSSMFELLSPLYNAAFTRFDQFVASNDERFSELYELVRYFLHRVSDWSTARVNSISNLLEPDSQSAQFYQALALNEYSSENELNRAILRSTSDFRGTEKRHYALFKEGHYGQVLSFFIVMYKGQKYNLCYCQRYDPAFDEHATGLEVVYTTENWEYEGRFVAPVSEIVRSAHIVPDFAHPTYSAISKYHYDQYLVNYDVSQYHWFEGRDKGILKRLDDSNLVTWSTESENAAVDENEELDAVVQSESHSEDIDVQILPWYLEESIFL